MVFSNSKWISLLQDISRLDTSFQWGSWSAASETNVIELKQQVEKESTFPCCQDELHLIHKLESAGYAWKPLLTQKILQQIS